MHILCSFSLSLLGDPNVCGDAINMAARIMDTALPGQILASASTVVPNLNDLQSMNKVYNEEDELDNIPSSLKTKQGYLKDNFVVSSSEEDEINEKVPKKKNPSNKDTKGKKKSSKNREEPQAKKEILLWMILNRAGSQNLFSSPDRENQFW